MAQQFVLTTTPTANVRVMFHNEQKVTLEQTLHFEFDAYTIRTLRWFLGHVINGPEVRHMYTENDWKWQLEYDPRVEELKQFTITQVGNGRCIAMSSATMRKLYAALTGDTKRLGKEEGA